MMVFKRKQIVILALILMIVVAGYLQYSYRQGSTSEDVDGKLGEAVYVDNEIDNEGLAGTELNASDNTQDQKNINASKMANDYFVQAKIDKEQSRSKTNESLKAITDDINASKETIAEAFDKMITITENADKEMRIESLINKMGFEESFVVFADNGSVDIVVKTPSLSTSQTAQITDIVIRQGEVAVKDIHIKPLF
ncbi:MAG: SpoIIIAH-like family protein [Clostridiaceae bacterium]